jgi:hypothetical protein
MAGGCVRYRDGGWVSSRAIAAVLPRESGGDLVRWLVKWLGGLESSIHSRTTFTDTYRPQAQMRPLCARDSCNWKRCVVRWRPTRCNVAAAGAGQQRHRRGQQ